MITGELKSQVDKIWNSFWTGGISNPLTVIEQFTFLLFLRRIDESQLLAEKKANMMGIAVEWQLTSQELKILYLNHFISFKKDDDAYIKRFPVSFWANGLFMLMNFIVLSIFLCFTIIANQGGLLMSLYTIGTAILISLILLDSKKSMLNPIRIISSKYRFT